MRFEVNVLGAKSDMIIEYIERLPEGARVSVRGLSKELGVSEGTAFKAIRLARRARSRRNAPACRHSTEAQGASAVFAGR